MGGARFVILFRGKVYQDKLGLMEGLISEFKGVRKELRDVTVAGSLTSAKGYSSRFNMRRLIPECR